MKLRLPIYAKILLWFFLNVALLAVVAALAFRMQLGSGAEMLLNGPAGQRLQSVANLLSEQLGRSPRADWDDILKSHGTNYHVDFFLFADDGAQLAGTSLTLPSEVALHVPMRPRMPDGEGRRRAPEMQPGDARRNPPRPLMTPGARPPSGAAGRGRFL